MNKFDKNQHQIVVTSFLQNLDKSWQTIRRLAKENAGSCSEIYVNPALKAPEYEGHLMEFDEIMISRYIKLDHICLASNQLTCPMMDPRDQRPCTSKIKVNCILDTNIWDNQPRGLRAALEKIRYRLPERMFHSHTSFIMIRLMKVLYFQFHDKYLFTICIHSFFIKEQFYKNIEPQIWLKYLTISRIFCLRTYYLITWWVY